MVDTFWGQGFAETLQDHSGFCWSLVVATTSSDHLDFIRFHQIASEFIRLHIRLISSYYIKSLDLCPFGVEVPVVAQEAPMPCHLRGWAHRHVATYCHSRVFIRQCREGTPPDLLHFLCFRRTCVRPSVPRRGSLECHCASANCRSHEVWAADHLQRVRVSREDVSQNVIV